MICLDIGNTNIVIGLYDNNKLYNVSRINTEQYHSLKKESDEVMAISSVVPKIEEFILQKFGNHSCFSISYLNSGITLNVDCPEEVGNDRLSNMKAIIESGLFPAIIIDFGSATTYDVIDENGHFIGGAIAPGIDVSAKYLFEKAAQLEPVDFKFPSSVIAKNTATNLQSGIMYGGADAVNGMLERIKKEMNNNINNIILTGGFSMVLSKYITHKHTVDPNLTLKGIRLIWEKNK